MKRKLINEHPEFDLMLHAFKSAEGGENYSMTYVNLIHFLNTEINNDRAELQAEIAKLQRKADLYDAEVLGGEELDALGQRYGHMRYCADESDAQYRHHLRAIVRGANNED